MNVTRFFVMDNTSIHNEREVRNILNPKNITLVKLVPYSYNFNPTELVFAIAKAYVRREPELLRANQCAFHYRKCLSSIVCKQYKITIVNVGNCAVSLWVT